MPINPLNLATGVQAGSGLLGSISSIINTNKTNKANMEMAKYAYSKDLEMWNRQNAYNDPSAQMLRYQAAGLNPNLIYGTGTASAGNATTLPKYQAPQMKFDYQAPNAAPAIGAYMDMKSRNAQIELTNENIKSAQLDNTYKQATLLEKISGSVWNFRNAQNLYDISANKAITSRMESENADRYYTGRGTQELEKGEFMRRMLQQQLANSIMTNQLGARTLEKYSADMAYTNQMTLGKKLENQWYGSAGIKSANDILPFIQMLLKGINRK